jgi:outer membrane protein, multidrug efflux system
VFAVSQALVQTRLALLQNQVALFKALGGGWSELDLAAR